MTFPITDTQVVLGKFLATFLVYLLMLLPTLVYVGVIRVFGGNEWGPLVSAYLGLVLLGGAFIAVGMFTSSLTRNQIVAGVLGIGILLLLWVLGAGSTVLGPRALRGHRLPLPERPLPELRPGSDRPQGRGLLSHLYRRRPLPDHPHPGIESLAHLRQPD